MQYRTLPGTELSVSRLCFGCWGIVSDQHWGARDEEECIRTMLSAADSGINFFDTATMYGHGASEELLGRVVSDNKLRDQLVIASKVPPDRMHPDQIVSECEASLRRLQTDTLDLYQTHWTHPKIPLEDSWQAMLKLQRQGKVRYIGVCNAGVRDLTQVCAVQKPVTNQLPWNLLWRMIEYAVLPACQEQSVGVLVYSPLMHGILADKYRTAGEVPDGRARSRHFNCRRSLTRHRESGCEEETFAALDQIRRICQDINRSMADVALAWLLQKPEVVSVIAGAGSPQQLQANLKSVQDSLPVDVVEQLENVTDALKAQLGTNPDMWDSGAKARYH